MSDSDSDSSSPGSVIADPSTSPHPPPSRRRSGDGSQSRPKNTDSTSEHPTGLVDTYRSHRARTASGRHGRESFSGQDQDIDPELRRQNIIAMDRKRRLTGSAYDGGRRRHSPSDFYARDNRHLSEHPLSLPPYAPQPRDTPGDSSRAALVDLTRSSPPTSPQQRHRESRTSSSSSRRYLVPRWQPDSEVTECPICKRAFTWMFRRHHCRKCGRVVCNDCSPHRITIPRQFIVNPPGPEMASSPARASQAETIDLTGDDDDEEPAQSSRLNDRTVNSTIEGGEKVRLCNPCVPDPQPEPLPNFPPVEEDSPFSSFGPRLATSRYPSQPSNFPQFGSLGQPSRFGVSAFQPSDRDLSLPQLGSGSLYTTRPRPAAVTNPYSVRYSTSDSAGNDMVPHSRSYNNPLPPIPGSRHPSSAAHGRFSSMDLYSRPTHPPETLRRPRMSSLIESGSRPPVMPSPFMPRASHASSSRPRLHEEDMCPVCRRGLPERGANGDETAREAHIMACINAREPNTASDAGSSSRGTVHMNTFPASEKDCIGGDGNPQECSICMEEYDVGDELARLECWCKFHKTCIVSWLNKKAECPVHKASAMHFI